MFLSIVFESSRYRFKKQSFESYLKYLYNRLVDNCCSNHKRIDQHTKKPIMAGTFEETLRPTYANQETNPHLHILLLIHNDTMNRFQGRMDRVMENIENPYPKCLNDTALTRQSQRAELLKRLPQPDSLKQEFENRRNVDAEIDALSIKRKAERAQLPTVFTIDLQKAVTPGAVANYIQKKIRTMEDFDENLFLFVPQNAERLKIDRSKELIRKSQGGKEKIRLASKVSPGKPKDNDPQAQFTSSVEQPSFDSCYAWQAPR